MTRHEEAGRDTVGTAERSAATERVRVVPVTLVAEPDSPPCGCAAPRISWGEMCGVDPRYVVWCCSACRRVGFLAFPAVGRPWLQDGVSLAQIEAPAHEAVEAIAGSEEAAFGLYLLHAKSCLLRRRNCRDYRIEAALDEALVRTVNELRESADRQRREHDAAESQRQWAHEQKMAVLRRMINRRKTAARVQLARRPAPSTAAPYQVIAEGRQVLGRIIYGLIDPREPARIRYVGKTIRGPHQRLAQHIADASYKGAKAEWLRALLADDAHPDMVLLETVRPDADIDALERWWIHEMRKQGHADLNTAIPATSDREVTP